jgi:hypothetical protein
MIRDDKKVLLLQKQQPIKPTIYMYTSAGKLIEQIQVLFPEIILSKSMHIDFSLQWDKGRIVALGWTDQEQLVVVTDDGSVRLYPLHGQYIQFSLGKVVSFKTCFE